MWASFCFLIVVGVFLLLRIALQEGGEGKRSAGISAFGCACLSPPVKKRKSQLQKDWPFFRKYSYC